MREDRDHAHPRRRPADRGKSPQLTDASRADSRSAKRCSPRFRDSRRAHSDDIAGIAQQLARPLYDGSGPVIPELDCHLSGLTGLPVTSAMRLARSAPRDARAGRVVDRARVTQKFIRRIVQAGAAAMRCCSPASRRRRAPVPLASLTRSSFESSDMSLVNMRIGVPPTSAEISTVPLRTRLRFQPFGEERADGVERFACRLQSSDARGKPVWHPHPYVGSRVDAAAAAPSTNRSESSSSTSSSPT